MSVTLRIVGDRWPPASKTTATLAADQSIDAQRSDLLAAMGIDAATLENYTLHGSEGGKVGAQVDTSQPVSSIAPPMIWCRLKPPSQRTGGKAPVKAPPGAVGKLPVKVPPPGAKLPLKVPPPGMKQPPGGKLPLKKAPPPAGGPPPIPGAPPLPKKLPLPPPRGTSAASPATTGLSRTASPKLPVKKPPVGPAGGKGSAAPAPAAPKKAMPKKIPLKPAAKKAESVMDPEMFGSGSDDDTDESSAAETAPAADNRFTDFVGSGGDSDEAAEAAPPPAKPPAKKAPSVAKKAPTAAAPNKAMPRKVPLKPAAKKSPGPVVDPGMFGSGSDDDTDESSVAGLSPKRQIQRVPSNYPASDDSDESAGSAPPLASPAKGKMLPKGKKQLELTSPANPSEPRARKEPMRPVSRAPLRSGSSSGGSSDSESSGHQSPEESPIPTISRSRRGISESREAARCPSDLASGPGGGPESDWRAVIAAEVDRSKATLQFERNELEAERAGLLARLIAREEQAYDAQQRLVDAALKKASAAIEPNPLLEELRTSNATLRAALQIRMTENSRWRANLDAPLSSGDAPMVAQHADPQALVTSPAPSPASIPTAKHSAVHIRLLESLYTHVGQTAMVERAPTMISTFPLDSLYQAVAHKLHLPRSPYRPLLASFLSRQFPDLLCALDVIGYVHSGREAEFAESLVLSKLVLNPQPSVWVSFTDGGEMFYFNALVCLTQWKLPRGCDSATVPHVSNLCLKRSGDLPANPTPKELRELRGVDRCFIAATVALLMVSDPQRLTQFDKLCASYAMRSRPDEPIFDAERMFHDVQRTVPAPTFATWTPSV